MPKDDLSQFDWLRPTASRLRGIANVSEERDLWVKGTLVEDPTVAFELSFECVAQLASLPGTSMTYLAMWRHRRTLIEFTMSQLVVKPDDTTYGTLIAPLIVRLTSYFPVRVDRRAIDAMRREQLAMSGRR